jgi:hypothetical protein
MSEQIYLFYSNNKKTILNPPDPESQIKNYGSKALGCKVLISGSSSPSNKLSNVSKSN